MFAYKDPEKNLGHTGLVSLKGVPQVVNVASDKEAAESRCRLPCRVEPVSSVQERPGPSSALVPAGSSRDAKRWA